MYLLLITLAHAAPCDDALYWSHSPVPDQWYDDENCYVEHPGGGPPFIWANQFYTEVEYTGCPLGWYDGANCYVQGDRPGSFVWDNAFYTAPWASGGVQCPVGSWFDGGNCYWFHADPSTTAFIYAGGWYTSGGPECVDGIYDSVHCYHGGPPAGTTAFIAGGAFYYTYDEVENTDALRHGTRVCGDGYDAYNLDGCINRWAPLRPSIERGVSTAEVDYHGSVYTAGPRTVEVPGWVAECAGYAGTTSMGLGPALPVDDTTRAWPDGANRAGDVTQLPYSRTSNDGRIALYDSRAFTIFRPDRVGYDDEAPAGGTWGWVPSLDNAVLGMAGSSAVYHSTICDASGGNIQPGTDLSENRNPRTCTWTEPGHGPRTGDCYDLTLLYAPEGYSAPDKRWWLGSIDVTVFVSNPKTASASTTTLPRMAGASFTTSPLSGSTPGLAGLRRELRVFWLDVDADGVHDLGEIWNGCDGTCGSATLPAGPDRSGVTHNQLDVFELTTAADGRLLILNAMDGLYYSYSHGTPCQANGFVRWLPLSHMPFDPAVAHLELARSGAATGGFRDVNGTVLPDKHRFVGAYPWVDRQARNLFYARTNASRDGWVGRNGYPGRSPNEQNDMDEIAGKGVVVVGAWTQGKMVHMDNLLNATDWGGVRSCEALPWHSTLHGRTTGLLRAFDVDLYRDGGPLRVRPGASSTIGGPENQFNHLDGLSPTLPADVVWRMSSNNGHTAELSFDDYLRNDAFVVAHMNASQRCEHRNGQPDIIPWDGFKPLGWSGDDFAFGENPRVQNASTASTAYDPTAVTGPTSLRLRGGARIEPVAMGGVLGKGVYLDGRNDFIDMGYQNTHRTDWSYSIWLDMRTMRHGDLATVFHWADGSWVAMSETTLRARHATGGIRDLNLSSRGLESGRWVHLSIDSYVTGGERILDVYLDGDPRPVGTLRWPATCTGTCSALGNGFSMDYSGLSGWSWFVVGSYGGGGVPRTFRGWVDELRIFALKDRGAAYREELRCNQALGTLRRDARFVVSTDGGHAEVASASAVAGPGWTSDDPIRVDPTALASNDESWSASVASYDPFGLFGLLGLFDDAALDRSETAEAAPVDVSHDQPAADAFTADHATADAGSTEARRGGELSFYGRTWCEQVQLESHDTPLELGRQRDFGVCIDAVHRNSHSGTSDCARDDMLGLVGRIPHVGTPRADQSSNAFCLSCHNPSHPIDGLRLTALTATGTPRECDGRRQPMDWVGVGGGATTSPMTPGTSMSCNPATGWGANAAWSWLADPWLDVGGKVVP
jgi:hypothetical protein